MANSFLKKILINVTIIAILLIGFRYIPSFVFLGIISLLINLIYRTFLIRFKGELINSTAHGVNSMYTGRGGRIYYVFIKREGNEKLHKAVFFFRRSARRFNEKYNNLAYYYVWKNKDYLVPKKWFFKLVILCVILVIPFLLICVYLFMPYSIGNLVNVF